MKPGTTTTKCFALYKLNERNLIQTVKIMNWPENFGITRRPRLGGSVGQRAAFYAYVAALNHGDFSRASQYFHPKISLSVPRFQVQKGLDAVVAFMKDSHGRFKIVEEVRRIIADDNAIYAEIDCTLTANKDDPDGTGLKKGETRVMEESCVYELKEGLIYKIESRHRT